MKSKYIITLVFLLTGLAFYSCKDDENNDNPVVVTQTPIVAGQVLTYSFTADNDTLVKIQDEAMDYGVTGLPAIMLVHKQTLILEDGYQKVFIPLDRDKLAIFIAIWAGQFNLDFVTDADKARVYSDFISFYVTNNLDPGLLVELTVGQGREISSLVSLIDEANRLKNASVIQVPEPNDLLYRLYSNENISPEDVIARYRPNPELKQGISIIMICMNIIIITEKWVNFVLDNEPVENFDENYASFVSDQDTIPSHYSGGTFFKTRDYKLSYDVGAMEAKVTYHLEGTYADTHPTIPGYYVASFNTVPTYVSCKGAGFIVDGKTSYSFPTNIGTFDVPVATYDGQVKTTYGDCCCFRKISYLNFRLNSQTGFEEVKFTTGK
jgi:hypothetical protein